MKKFLIALFLTITCIFAVAQEQDVTKFLGIPVDGFKPQMITKLKQKGFVATSDPDVLRGEFNGYSVKITPVTNNNKVYRIFIEDDYFVSEEQIKIRFNNLCRQFEKNSKYTKAGLADDFAIPDDENIYHQMKVNKKSYQASYWQIPANIDSTIVFAAFQDKIRENFTEEQINNPSEEDALKVLKMSILFTVDLLSKRSVWFKIQEQYGRFRILMYYDNEYNRADGEDL